jgi:prepilin-type N-terminal cleavage/methylation domain-containing protein
MKSKYLKNQKGMTLIEVILAIAILGIIMIGILNLFSFSMKSIYSAGNRTHTVADLESISDELIASEFSSKIEIENHLADVMNFNEKTDKNSVAIKEIGEDINFYVSNSTVLEGTSTIGYVVTIVKFHSNGKQSSKITVFLVEGGM